MMKNGIETNQTKEATMGHIEVRCPVSLQIKARVNTLDDYYAIAIKAIKSASKRFGVHYEAYNTLTGVVTNLDTIGWTE